MDYLLWEIDWYVVQRMLIDAVKVKTDKSDSTPAESESANSDLNFNVQSSDSLMELFTKHLT